MVQEDRISKEKKSLVTTEDLCFPFGFCALLYTVYIVSVFVARTVKFSDESNHLEQLHNVCWWFS